MFCFNCGIKLNDSYNYCTSCGTKLKSPIQNEDVNKIDNKINSIKNEIKSSRLINNTYKKTKKGISNITRLLLIGSLISIAGITGKIASYQFNFVQGALLIIILIGVILIGIKISEKSSNKTINIKEYDIDNKIDTLYFYTQKNKEHGPIDIIDLLNGVHNQSINLNCFVRKENENYSNNIRIKDVLPKKKKIKKRHNRRR